MGEAPAPQENIPEHTGVFAYQNGAAKLRNRLILNQLTAEFGLDDDGAFESDMIATGR